MAETGADAFVFFGATGDLAWKQVFPALQALIREEELNIPIIGVAKSGWTVEQLQARIKDSLEHHGGVDTAAFQRLVSRLHYIDGDYSDPATFTALRKEMGAAKLPLHYLAIPPLLFSTVAEALANSGCADNARLVVEKPFGHDLASARELNRLLHRYFHEDRLYRIDHYLGKEAVQNILYTRFANPIFEPIWNRHYVRSIQITMAEDFGVEDRGHFYDETGALRDVVQNHLLQVLAMLTMDPPTGAHHDAVRDQKASLLKALRPLHPNEVVRGQYQGYRSIAGVAAGSKVETYAAACFHIESWRWAGVPIYIRTGKKLPLTATEIMVEFRRPPRETFGELVTPNSSHMRLRVGPDIAIALGVRMKTPGEQMIGDDLELMLQQRPELDAPPYQRLLGDALRGDGELFARQDAVEAQWRAVQPTLDNATPFYVYEPGTWGPSEANQLIGADGPWINPSPAAR